MSMHSYSRVWLHLIWATLERRPLLSKTAAPKVSAYLSGAEVARYIASQEEHDRKKSFADEFKLFIKRYELQWHDD